MRATNMKRFIACACFAVSLAHAAWTPSVAPGGQSLALPDQPNELALASRARVLAVGTDGTETVKLVNPDTGDVTRSIKLDKKPIGLALSADGTRLYVLQDARKFVYVFDTASGNALATWSFSGDPVALALRPNAAEVLVADKSGKRIVALNAASGVVIRQRVLSAAPEGVAVNAADTRAVVATADGKVVTLDTATLNVVSTVAVGDQARWVGFWDRGGVALVVQKKVDALSLVNVESGAVLARVELSTDPEKGAVDGAGTKAFVSTVDDLGVNQIDLDRRASDGRFILPSKAAGLLYDPVARAVYVSLAKDKLVYRLDPAQSPLLADVVLKKRLRDIAVSNATHEAATIADAENELARVRLRDRAVDTVALPDKPSLVAIDSGRNLAVMAVKKALRFATLDSRPPALLPRTATLAKEPRAIAVDSSRGVTLAIGKGGQGETETVASGDDPAHSRIDIIDNANGALLASAGSTDSLRALAIDEGRGVAYVVTSTRKLLTFDLASRTFVRTIALAFQPDAIAVDAALNMAVLTDASKDKAYVMSLASGSITRTLDVPRGPVAVQVQSQTHTAVIASKEADQVSLLDLATGVLRTGYATIDSPFALAISTRYNQALVLSGEKDEITIVPLPNALPQLASIAPAQATAGSPAFTLAATGSGFADGAKVLFGSIELVTRWIDGARLEADVPATLVAATGGGSVRVRNPGPGGGDSNAITFAVVAAPLPLAISAMDPAAGLVGSTVRLTGVGFNGAASANQVAFSGPGGGVAAVVQSATPTQLVVTVPAGAVTGPIRVTNARGTASSPAFTVLQPLAVTAIAPGSGVVGAQVTLTGSGFSPLASDNQVTFKGAGSSRVAATVVTAGETQLVVVVPAGAETGAIRVTNASGSADSTTFTVLQPPRITAFSPSSGPVLSVVTITGSGFDASPSANTVSFASAVALVLSASSDTLVVRVPPGAATGAVSVTTAGGTAVGPVFTVTPQAQIDVQLLASPALLTVYQGAAGSIQVQLASIGLQPFNGIASLSVSGLPAGVTAQFTPAASISAFQPNTLVLTAAQGASTGDSTLTITATSTSGETLTRTASVALKMLASAGVTGVKGRFVTPGGEGIAGVIVRADNGAATQPQTGTDAAGNFQLVGLSGGTYTLRFDATPANPLYPIWPYSIAIEANRIVVIPDWTINPPPADDKFTPIANAAAEQVISDPRFPGLEVRLPAGAVITGWDGVRKTRMAVEKVEISRLPVSAPPTPTGAGYQLYFGTPMGGIPSQPIPVTLPNDVHAEPGESVDVWFFDGSPMGGSGEWKVAGQGVVSLDGRTVKMANGTGIPRFCGVCGLMCLGKQPPAPNPPPGPPPPCDGNPVDLSQGQEMPRSKGMTCGGLTPIDAGMSYNPVDAFNGIAGTSGTIGYGWVLDYDIAFLPFDGPQKRLILPGNNRVNFIDAGGGIYRVENDPRFDGATIRATNLSANFWELKFKDGRIWRFRPYPGVLGNIRGGPPTFVNEMVDSSGNVLAVNRQSEGKLVSVGSVDRNISFTFGANGFASEMRDTANRVMRFGYNAKGRLASVTDPDNRVTSYTYVDDTEFTAPAACGTLPSLGERLKTITYPGRPNPTTNDYGPGRRVLRQVGFDGREFRFNYRIAGACVTHVSSPNTICTGPTCPNVDSWENFQAGWRLHGGNIVGVTVVQPNGQTYGHTFDALGVATGMTDTFGQTSVTRVDSMNRPVEMIDPLGRSQRMSYDANGNLIRMTDALGRVTQITHHPVWNKPTSVTRLDDLGQPLTWSFAYHPQNGNVVSTSNPAGQSTAFTYTPRGQLETVTNPMLDAMSFEYDSVGDLVKAIDALARPTRMSYDGAGRRVSITDPLEFVTRMVYDGVGNVTRITDALLKNTDMSYDTAGRLQSVTNARGKPIESYTYDANSRLSVRTDALSKGVVIQYDNAGRPASITDRKGAVTTYAYDADDRLASVSRPDRQTRYGYDLVGRLVSITDATSSIGYAYDNADRLTAETQTAAGLTTTVRYQYDALDRRISRTVSGVVNETTNYAYDRAGRLERVTYRGRQTIFEYDAAGRVVRKTLPNGIVQAYAHDRAGRVTQIKFTDPGGSTIDTLDYGYDERGKLVSETRSSSRAPETAFSAAYDAADRLTSMTMAATGRVFNFTYDDNGNMLTKVEQGNPANATAYTWDASDRLRAIAGPGISAAFDYDGKGRRVSRTVNGATTRYVYDGDQAIAEVRATGTDTILSTLALDEVIARYGSTGSRTYLTDAVNSVLAQVADDRSLVSRYDYSAYGEATGQGADEGNDVQFQGRESDGTGLLFFRSRYYDPVLKRFLQSDVAGLGGGINMYAFVEGNPISNTDPEGLAACYVSFPDMPIEYAPGQTSTSLGGHAGVLGYDANGVTRYYEYGRYAPNGSGIVGQSFPADMGNVRRVPVPNFTMGPDGEPTPQSMAAMREALSTSAGKGTPATLSCDKKADEKKVYDHVEKIAKDKKRPPYEWKPWKNQNHCRTFAEKAFGAGR